MGNTIGLSLIRQQNSYSCKVTTISITSDTQQTPLPSENARHKQIGVVPHIHREIVAQAQNCKHGIEKGKNLKPILLKK